MFPFSTVPNDKEPTKEELFEGLVHYLSSDLLLHGAGRHFCKWVDELRYDTLSVEDIHKIMNHCNQQHEKLKTIFANLPTIQVHRDTDTGG